MSLNATSVNASIYRNYSFSASFSASKSISAGKNHSASNGISAGQNYSVTQSVSASYSYSVSQEYSVQIEQSKPAEQTDKTSSYGKTVGEPKLSEKASKYYEELKKKYGDYDFILVGKDEKENAKANAAKFANNIKTVVLVDEETIERMASDENYRKKYEGILDGAKSQLEELKNSLMSSGAKVQGFGMQVNDNGTTSYFAVLKKSTADQKARIEKGAEKKKLEKKEADKKAAKKAAQKNKDNKAEKLKNNKADKINAYKINSNNVKEKNTNNLNDNLVVSGNSIEELMNALSEYSFNEKSDNSFIDEELTVGQHVDCRA